MTFSRNIDTHASTRPRDDLKSYSRAIVTKQHGTGTKPTHVDRWNKREDPEIIYTLTLLLDEVNLHSCSGLSTAENSVITQRVSPRAQEEGLAREKSS